MNLDMKTSDWIARVLVAALCMLAPAVLYAQADETDVGEAAAFTGGAFGLGSHPIVGGSLGTTFWRYGMALIETSFSPLDSNTLRVLPGAPAAQTSHLYDLNLSVHIRIPVRRRWAPYAILGGGFLWDKYNLNLVGPQGVAAVSRYTNFNFGFHTGAGLRYYIRENWGIRPEVKVVVSTRPYTRVSMGIFYVLPVNWP
jgi:hypothetical protein